VPHTVIADNAGGHLMQHGQVDLVIVGTDRTSAAGDVCNKIGTYLKALAAHDNGVPVLRRPPAAVDRLDEPSDGFREIPIEERSPRETLAHRRPPARRRAPGPVALLPEGSPRPIRPSTSRPHGWSPA
jgi:methylthioribose-1-phosphate isomerase